MKKFLSAAIVSAVGSSAFASSVTVNGFDIQTYGFVKASSMYSTQSLASYNNVNLSAPTNAMARTASRPEDKTSRMSVQTQQSRVGFNLKKDDNLSTKLEFDFIDFNKSSPTVQMNPRVRIMSVTYTQGNHKFVVGQDWDLFSPTTTYTYDYVGLYFLAGNSGFMRQQAQYFYTDGNWEYGGALGMSGNNPGVVDNDLEVSKSPSYSARVTRKLEKGRIGLSGIFANFTFNRTSTTAKTVARDAYAGNFFYEQIFDRLEVKAEAYYGQNLANIGSLTIGKGTQSLNAKEFGGTLTGNYKVAERHFIFGGTGLARMDNRTGLSALNISSSTNVISQPGIRSNWVARVGWDYRITPDLSWISELSRYETTSKIAHSGAADSYQTNVVFGLESGIQLRF